MVARIIRRREVEEMVGLSRSTIYALMKRDLFPRPVRLGARAVGWREAEISAWISSRNVTQRGDG